MLSMRKCSWAMSGAFVACLTFAAHGSANVFDDAVFWFRGGKDCVTADGYMQPGEFFDDLHADAASHDNHWMSMSSSGYYIQDKYAQLRANFKENAVFQPEQVVFPALGVGVVREMQVLHISDVGVIQNARNWYFPFSVNPRSIFTRYSISNEYTIVSRIRLDDLDRVDYIFKIGYDESNNQGMKLGFLRPSDSYYGGCKCLGGYCSPSADNQIASFQLRDLPIPTNTWVDVAVVVGNGKLRVGIAAPQSLASHNNNPTIGFAETPMWTDKCQLLDSDESYCLFCPENISSYSQNNQDCFLGSVQQLAIWGRALSDQEVMAAFGMPRPAIFRTGFDNGSSSEFGGTRTASIQTIDGLGSWQGVWNKMLGEDEWTVNFTALRDEANLAQIFSVKSLRGSAAAQIEPILNGTSLGERRVASCTRVFWPVAKNLVNTGANTLVIKRKDDGAGDFYIDAMELGGSLGVGRESESATNDQRIPPDRSKTGVPSAADPNTQHWPQGLRPKTGVTNLHFRVWMDPDVVNKVTSRFWTRTKCEEEEGKTIKDDDQFLFYVNGANKGARGSGTNWDIDPIELIFKPGELNGGWNDVEFISTSSTTNCRWLVDYFRFETVLPRAFSIPPPGMTVFIR